jgi:hypothetical protein
MAHLGLLILLCTWLLLRSFPGTSWATFGLWLTAIGSLGWLKWLALGCAVPGRTGMVMRALIFGLTMLSFAWFTASLEIFLDQGHTLDDVELRQQLGNVAARAIIIESLLSTRMGIFTGGSLLIYLAIQWSLRLIPPRSHFALCLGTLIVMTFAGVVAIGTSWFGDVHYYISRQIPMSAPWSFVQRFTYLGGVAPAKELHVDAAAGRNERQTLDPAFWASGPDPVLAPLAGRYLKRKIIAIIMESHRLSDIDGVGEGAYAHQANSPFLGQLIAKGLFFSNYIQSGPGTAYAQITAILGVTPAFNFYVDNLPDLYAMAKLGRIPDFQRAGYSCDWLQCTNVRFAGFDNFLAEVDMPSWYTADETRSLDRTYWTQWGIPDEQLYQVAWQRYLAQVHENAPHLQLLLTISNHHPYSFPSRDGSYNHRSGMRYADACLATFIGHLLALPAAERPIIFITADHSVRWNLEDAKPLGAEGLESIRIPGCLILPDGAAAGSVCDAPIAHQDLLDLLYLLTTPTGAAGQRRFLDVHRIAIPTVIGADHSILTRDGFFHAPSGTCYRIHDRWQLALDTTPELEQRLINAHAAIETLSHAMWMGGK